MRIGQRTNVIVTPEELVFSLAEDFFLRSPKMGQKNRLNFGEDLFFLEIT